MINYLNQFLFKYVNINKKFNKNINTIKNIFNYKKKSLVDNMFTLSLSCLKHSVST